MSEIFATPWLFITLTGLLGAFVGSFLNVVILRLPPRIEWQWHRDCAELQGDESFDQPQPPGLALDRSRCPKCGYTLRWYENIPIVSYLALRGRCSNCGQPVSLQYPLVELLTAIVSALIAAHFGATVTTAAALLFAWMLIAMSGIDFRTTLLPDVLTLSLLWLGLLASLFGWFAQPSEAIVGAVLGYLSLWSVFWAFKLLTGKEGMGYGDFKLLAALGAWMGYAALPMIILASSAVGAIIGIIMILSLGRDRNIPLPFGPYLAGGGLVALLYGDAITDWYLQLSGLGA